MPTAKKPPKRSPKKPARKKATKKAPEQLALNLSSPGNTLHTVFIPRTAAGIRVDHDNALTLAAVWGCVRVISESVACMPWQIFRRDSDGGKTMQPQHPAQWMLLMQANDDYLTAFSFVETITAWTTTWGNGYAEIERDYAGRPLNLWPLAPDRVRPDRTQTGKLIYDVWNRSGPNTVLNPADTFHCKGLGWDGLIGYSVIHMAAQCIGLGLAAEQFGATLFGNGALPGGLFKHPGKLTEEAKKNFRATWNAMHQGPGKAHSVGILEEGMEYQVLGIPPEDAQFIGTRERQGKDICIYFRVPPHKIADLDRAIQSNINQQELSFILDTVMPWAKRLETEADLKLFGRNQQGNFFTKLDMMARLRGDHEARSNYYKALNGMGVLTVNDILVSEDMNPIGKDGDKRLVPVNMTTLEKVGASAPPPANGAAPFGKPGEPPPKLPGTPSNEEGDKPTPPAPVEQATSALIGPFRRLFADALERVLSRERNMGQKAARKHAGDESAYRLWLKSFLAEHREYVHASIASPAFALAEIIAGPRLDRETLTAHLDVATQSYLTAAERRLLDGYHQGFPEAVDNGQAQTLSLKLSRQTLAVARLADDQPRMPAGSPEGGEFAPKGEGGSSGGTTAPSRSSISGKVSSSHALGGGVNETRVVDLEGGSKGVFKPLSGEYQGARDAIKGNQYKREAAAYDVAEDLGVHDLVPPTVVREVNGEKGSMQHYVEGAELAKKMSNGKEFNGPKDLARAAAFDMVTLNTDRHMGNWMQKDGKLVLIDNGLSFPDTHGYEESARGVSYLLGEAMQRDMEIPAEVKGWKGKEDKVRNTLLRNGLSHQEANLAADRIKALTDPAHKTFRQAFEAAKIKTVPQLNIMVSKLKQPKVSWSAETQA